MPDRLEFPAETEAAWAELHEAARGLKFLCVTATTTPTADQLKSLQAFFPQDNVIAVRRRLLEGRVRIGPLQPEDAEAFAIASLAGTGLEWHLDAPTDAELDAMGLGPLSGA